MSMSPKKVLLVLLGVLVLTAIAAMCFVPAEEPSYAGKPLSFWCDHLPMTVQVTIGRYNYFLRGTITVTNREDEKYLRDMEKRSQGAVDALGTNCLTELLGRFERRPSRLESESLKLAAKVGLIEPTEVNMWLKRRGQALTGILLLGHRAEAIVPELTKLKDDPDPWLSAAASHVLKQMAIEGGPTKSNQQL